VGNKTVIFDFDGTLANSISVALKIYNQFADGFGTQPVTEADLPALRKLGYKKAMKAKNVKIYMLPKMLLVLTKELKKHMHEVKPYPGIAQALEKLKSQGYSIGILTSNQEGLVQEFINVHKFPSFDFLVSEKTLFGKDKALKRIIRRHGLNKHEVIYVGDEPRDSAASRRTGIVFVGVTWGLAGSDGYGNKQPNYLVSTPSELVKVLISQLG
jgi:phosphoglycolate phosphatase